MNHPPKWITRFFQWFCREDLKDAILGDLFELYDRRVKTIGKRRSDWLFFFNTIQFLQPFILKRTKNRSKHMTMFTNNFKIGYRNLIRNRGYSVINIIGLAIGLSVSLLIGLWIYDELTYDHYFQHHDKIAQVMQHQTNDGTTGTQSSLPFPIKAEMESKYGELFKYMAMSSWLNNHVLSFDDKKVTFKGIYMGEDAPHLFSLEMVAGSRDGLDEMHSILLAESTARVLFGKKDPVNKSIRINNQLTVKVTGVYRDFPVNTTMHELKFIAPWELFVSSNDWVQRARESGRWDNNSFQMFVRLDDRVDYLTANTRIKKIKYDNMPENERLFNPEIFLHPMNDWHLRSRWVNGKIEGGLIDLVWLFAAIGVFAMILACINFMNLTTAHSIKRSREVGIRKSIGSHRLQLIGQFLTESLLVVVFAFILGLILTYLSLPYFNLVTDKQISMPFQEPVFWLSWLSVTVITSLIAGSYPAFYLSSFHPVQVLKGTLKSGGGALFMRRFLVVLQFTIAISLIIGTVIIEKQIVHLKNRPLGYDKEGTILIDVNSPDYEGKFDVLRNELLATEAIVDMAQSSSTLTSLENESGMFSWEGMREEFYPQFGMVWVSHSFGNTVEWEIIEGRDFSRELDTDSSAIILNEEAVKYMNIQDPVGKIVKWGGSDGKKLKIIGVVRNLLMNSPFREIKQTFFLIEDGQHFNWMEIRLNPNLPTSESLSRIEIVFDKIFPALPFDYKFIDQEYEQTFKLSEKIERLSIVFTFFSLFISCIGLFGLASFIAEHRTREIGIRKVLGASVVILWRLITREFVLLVMTSCLIAIPITYYTLGLLLRNYADRTELSWWIFVGASIGAILIALFTVSFQALKVAAMNPVKSLRSE